MGRNSQPAPKTAPDSIIFKWGKGHNKQHDVDQGHVRPEDKQGNDAADALAVAGAAASGRAGQARFVQRRMALTMQTHRMMLDILAARQALRRQTTQNADVQHARTSEEVLASNSGGSDSSSDNDSGTTEEEHEMAPD